jgi:peptide-methionine (S)-S-oxide reductase
MRTHLALLVLLVLPACRGGGTTALGPDASAEPALAPRAARVGTDPGHAGRGTPLSPRPGHELAAFAAGCFWGVEETFRQVPGVIATAVGYSGGHTDDPTYETVCSHTTGHAETVLVEFDPKAVSYAALVNVFFKNHDPTTKDRQGPDVGDQYRSAVFTFSPEQATAAAAAKQREATALGRPVVTIVEPVGRFWKAEEYHQQYDEKTGTRSCPMPKGLPAQGT